MKKIKKCYLLALFFLLTSHLGSGQDYDVDMFVASADWTGGTNQVWTPTSNPLNDGAGADVYVRGEIRIPANINVRISGMTLYFHPEAKVVVERSDVETLPNGAKLVLKDSTVLTVDNRFDDTFMWQGVEVQGWKNQSQLPLLNSRQGLLQLFANTRIEHALIGAKAQGSESNNRGGIIQATNATFYNNWIDIKFHDYQNLYLTGGSGSLDNLSFFRSSQFITEGLLNIASKHPLYHVQIYKTNGIQFLGNTFENLTPELYSENRLGHGIYNLHSKLTVIPSCTGLLWPCTPIPNTFKSLNYGIYCATSSSVQAIKIDQNEFVDNMHGVYISKFDYPTITRNNFQIASSVNPDFKLGRTYGIYLASSSGFKVEENDLREYDDASAITGQTRGIIVANSGVGELIIGDDMNFYYHNEIYKNTFTDLLVGGQSQGTNSIDHGGGTSSHNGGLQWLCNDFNPDVWADLYIPTGRIDKHQGAVLDPDGPHGAFAPFAGARNLFSETDTIGIVVNAGVQFSNYVYYDNSETDPLFHSYPRFQKLKMPLTIDYNVSCPSQIPTVGIEGGGIYEGLLKDTVTALDDRITNELALIDGGNTDSLLALIASGTALEIHTGLMADSAYLSDTVLTGYMVSNPPNNYLEDVLLANSPLSNTAWAVFNTLTVPATLITNVTAAQTGLSARGELENFVGYLSATRAYWIDESIRYYLNDTTISSGIDTVISILENETGLLRKQQLCDAYITKGDTANAQIVLTEIIGLTGASSYTDVAGINIDYRFEEDAMAKMNADTVLLATLQSIAEDSTHERDAMRAQALLYEYVYADSILHWVEPLLINGQNRMPENNGEEVFVSEKGEPAVFIYPNPAADQLTITLEDVSEFSAIEIDFYNAIGQQILTVPLAENQVGIKIDVSTLPTGLYLVNVRSNQGVISTERVVVE